MKKDDEELVKDQAQVNLSMTENEIIISSKAAFKTIVKNKVKTATFKAFIEAKNSYSKVQKLTYKSLEHKSYLKSPIFDCESATMLFLLITRTVRGNRKDFRGMFDNVDCPLGMRQY